MILIVGSTLGFLTGLGIGGGSLLIIWLTAVLGMDPAAARGINLLFFIPGALIASVFRRKQGAIRRENVVPCALAGCIAAVVCSHISTAVDTGLIRKLFGFLLIAAGIRELLWKEKAQGR